MIGPFVDVDWLVAHRDDVVVCDVRWYLDGRSGLDAYARGHLPGAVFVDLDVALAAPPTPTAGRHPLPDPEVFAHAMGGLGIGDDDVVVAYDDASGAVAARLVWMLRGTEHAAAVLDGGMTAWRGALAREVPERPTRRFTARDWPRERIADLDEVRALSQALTSGDRSGRLLLDARVAERYRGDHEPVDPRAGHVPGAHNVPLASLLEPDGRMRDARALRADLSALGWGAGAPVMAYCGSGVNASLLVLALEHAGVDARLFPGSWSQWSSEPNNPVHTGPRP